MENKYSIAITTVGSREDADKLARALVESRLAACVQITPLQSYYRWQEEINVDEERMLIIKCRHLDFGAIAAFIRANHAYQIPEIIELPIVAGFPPYLNWIEEVTNGSQAVVEPAGDL